MGLDVGSSVCKSAIYTSDGEITSVSTREYPMYHPRPGWAELDPDEVWLKLVETIRESISLARLRPDDILGLSVSSQGEAVVPLDSKGNWVYRAIHGYDTRTIPQSQWWRDEVGALQIFRITGQPLHPMYTINKMMWLRDQKPEIYQKARKFLCFEDYVIWKLSDQTATDYSIASRTMAFDVTKKEWSRELLDEAEISEELFADVFPSGRRVGEVCSKAAKETGLARTTAVVTGGHDQPCGALGVGVISPGPVMDATGTIEAIAVAMRKPLLNKRMLSLNYACYCHVKEEMYFTVGGGHAAGLLFRWIRDEFCEKEKENAEKTNKIAYDLMTENAASSPLGSSGVYVVPYFLGSGTPTSNPYSRGVIFGLQVSHRKNDMIRAALEGITYELRRNVELLETLCQVTEIRTIGGGTKSELWLQLKADITGKRIVVPSVTESVSLGAALLAGVGTGVFSSVDRAVENVYEAKFVVKSDDESHEKYDLHYKEYLHISRLVDEFFRQIQRKNQYR